MATAMAVDIRKVKNLHDLVEYFSAKLGWSIDFDDFDEIEDITYDFDAADIGLKEEAFAKISALRQLPPLVDGQRWGIFSVEFDSKRFEVTALRKILSGIIPKRRNSADHAVWDQQDLLFLCFWGYGNERTIGVAHFTEQKTGLPQIRMMYCAPAIEDFTQIHIFEERLSKLEWPVDTENIESWQKQWSSAFATGYRQTIKDSSTLTIQLAVEAQNIRDRILETLEVETEKGYVHTLYEKFKNTLIHDMTEQQFADMYAQTVVYGLFSARYMDTTQEDFSAAEAVACIPNTNPFLKRIMQECLGVQANSHLSFDELEIGDVVELLRHTQTEAIIQDFNRQTGGGREDPVIHFYEEFLTAYDKAQKIQRGVYYTPQPVVNFIVRAVDDLLKSEFGVADGLASIETKKIKITRESKKRMDGIFRTVEDTINVPAVQVLDPSTGTGTFLRQVILQIYSNFQTKAKAGSVRMEDWSQYVEQHLLPRLNGFELMMAPYAVARMKLAMVLKDTGYTFAKGSRLKLFLTNTLEEPGSSDAQITWEQDPLALESIEANEVKNNNGINVVLGNPPYSGESANKGEYALSLINRYKIEPGGKQKLQEKNPKWLNDDYVKFIRYAQEMVSRVGKGIVAFINPHGFIGNPTFRGMRWSLMRTFNQIYILDLHGNSNRKETAPDGSKDENIFDIQQGVCICFFVKKQASDSQNCRVFHADLYGTRESKYHTLNNASVKSVTFTEITPRKPSLIFHPIDYNLRSDYDKGFSVNDLFTLGSVGVVTARDSLTLGFTDNELIRRADDFRKLPVEEARSKYALGKDVRDWRVELAQADLNDNAVLNGSINASCVIPIMYRVFDQRKMIYTGTSRGFVCYPRTNITATLFWVKI